MIPINLTLRNFMSYGDEPTTLPFEGLHVACLSGDNGNGKSALLDAMTWALWGKTRASSVGSVSDDDLIRLGAAEMEVRFEFELNEQQYRVVKKRKKGKQSGVDWQFTQINSDGQHVPIGGGSVRDTGKSIIQVLSMEYETFLNSAYLQQGHADEFTRQRPNDRKRILAEILGLSRYDRLEEKAREKFKQKKSEEEELAGEIRLLEAQADELETHKKNLELTCLQLAEMEAQIQQQEQVTTELRDRRSQLEALAHRAADANALFLRLSAEVQEREREHNAKQIKLQKMQETLSQRESILGDYDRLQTLRQRREKLDPEIERLNKIQADLRTAIGVIDIAATHLKHEIALQKQQTQEIERRRADAVRLDSQSKTLQSELQDEARIAAEFHAAQAALQDAQDTFAALRTRNERLKQDVIEIDEVLALLASSRAACPVCESDLSGPKQAAVLAKQEAKRTALLAEQDSTKREGAAAKQTLSQIQESVKQLDATRSALTAKRAQYDQFTHRLNELKAQGIDAKAAQQQLLTLEQQLERGEFAGPERARRVKLEKEVALLTLTKAEHEEVVGKIRTLTGAEQRFHQYQEVSGNWENEFKDSERMALALAEKAKERDAAGAKRDAHQAEATQYETVKAQAAIAENDLSRLHNERGVLLGSEKSLRNYIVRCEQAKTDLKSKKTAQDKAREERQMYNALVQAFGKKGIQTYIIENALPELEDEANSLLSRMTDSAMSVSFETTRAAQQGNNVIETLDIKIQDDAGIRPYELFSGGEGFRVNFAIRIALSRLLARRSGAKLETLIMDEGFGSQDGKGREKLIEVIESIKDDFKKILVITHFEEMKDAFAQRIEVVKDAQGSRIHVL